ncbi:hypothetical protein ACP3P8_23185 [Pseudomonas aeruginosa]
MNDNPFEPGDFRVLVSQARWNSGIVIRRGEYPDQNVDVARDLVQQRARRWLAEELAKATEPMIGKVMDVKTKRLGLLGSPEISFEASLYLFTEQALLELVRAIRHDEQQKAQGLLNLEVPLDAELQALRSALSQIIGDARDRVTERHRALLGVTASPEN